MSNNQVEHNKQRRIEERIRKLIGKYNLKPNTEETRIQLTEEIRNELESNNENYAVICDQRNNPPSAIDNNRLNVDIMLRPTKGLGYTHLKFK